MLFTLIFGSLFESIVGPLRMFIIYIISGMGGVLVSSLADDHPAVGASTSLMGIVGGLLAFLIINWKALASHTMFRCYFTIVVVILIILTMLGAMAGGVSA